MKGVSRSAGNTLEKVASEFAKEVIAELEGGRDQALESLELTRRETIGSAAKILETGRKQADSLRRQMIGSSELESRNLHLRLIEDSVNEVFATAMAKAAATSPSEYENALTRLITEGVGFIGATARVACRSEDSRLVSSVIKKLDRTSTRLTLDEKSLNTIGGIALTSPDGTVKFDNTFEARLKRLRPMLRKEVANLLTGGQA